MFTSAKGRAGFTLVEILAVLGIIAILAAVTTPAVIKHLQDSKVTRATHDVDLIGAALTGFYKDLGHWPTHNDTNHSSGDQEIRILWTADGKNPGQAQGVRWTNLTPRDTFENQLVLNTPNNRAQNAYTTTGDAKWAGPYQLRFKCDPWGNRYLCNVRAFHPGITDPAWVISAGPDGILQTRTSDLTIQGDDLGFMLKR